jgi:hypothetical protein
VVLIGVVFRGVVLTYFAKEKRRRCIRTRRTCWVWFNRRRCLQGGGLDGRRPRRWMCRLVIEYGSDNFDFFIARYICPSPICWKCTGESHCEEFFPQTHFRSGVNIFKMQNRDTKVYVWTSTRQSIVCSASKVTTCSSVYQTCQLVVNSMLRQQGDNTVIICQSCHAIVKQDDSHFI